MDSNTILAFLRAHPMIRPNAIEELLGIPTGTIRPSGKRSIPTKYIKLIAVVLREYGCKDE